MRHNILRERAAGARTGSTGWKVGLNKLILRTDSCKSTGTMQCWDRRLKGGWWPLGALSPTLEWLILPGSDNSVHSGGVYEGIWGTEHRSW